MKQSNALWPEGVCHSMYGDNISTDLHRDEEAALAVCAGLERGGFGGMRQHFPVKTWVSDPQDPPQVPPPAMSVEVQLDIANDLIDELYRSGELSLESEQKVQQYLQLNSN